MALTISYNNSTILLSDIYRASSGGTVFSSNLGSLSSYDLFDDTAVVDDAIYFCEGVNRVPKSDLLFSISTALVATSIELAWEYYHRDDGWVAIEDLVDNTNSFQNTGSVRVRYPVPWTPGFITVNGQANRGWVRCRIVSVSGLTEGGAVNARTRHYDGRVQISGTDDTTPATFEDVYQWLLANEPHISISKRNNISYNFTKVGFQINSTLRTRREIIEMGCNCTVNGATVANNMDYIWSGIKINETTGYQGSTFLVYGAHNSGVFGFSTTRPTARLYGSTIKTPATTIGSTDNNFSGYTDLRGEWIDNDVEMSIGVPGTDHIVNNIRIIGSLAIFSVEIGQFDNVKYTSVTTLLFYLYNVGFVVTGFDWSMLGSGTLFSIYNTNGNDPAFYWDLVNPVTPIPLIDATPVKGIRATTNTTSNYTKAIYSSSAGDVDITTKTNTSTGSSGAYNLEGAVGDYYAYGYTGQSTALDGFGFSLEELLASNDGYEYVFEVYRGAVAGWVAVDEVYDGTFNFTETGRIFFIVTPGYGEHSLFGTTAAWIRIRITAVGTTPPTISRMRKARFSGQNRWNLREIYTAELRVQDIDTNNIEGATVTFSANGTEIFTETTDVNGEISNQFISKHWYFDPVNNKTTFIQQDVVSNITITVEKAGYETYVTQLEPGKIHTTVTLKKAVPLLIDSNGEAHLRFNKENVGSNRELIS